MRLCRVNVTGPSFEDDKVLERGEMVVQVEESGAEYEGNFKAAGHKGVCQCSNGVDSKEDGETGGFQ